jgi:proteasome accessory factor B
LEKTERLLDLVALLLDAREPVPFARLRELFPGEYGGSVESAQRKLERDKSELQKLGVPVEYVEPSGDDYEHGGYRVDRKAYFLPDPKLLPEEAAALYAAGALALEARHLPFAEDLRHALGKLSLVESFGTGPMAARRLLVVRPGRTEHLKELADAVARRKRVHIEYDAPPSLDGRPGEHTERDVDPWGLAFRGGAWRLVGYCHLRQAERVFVVDRIARAEINPRAPSTADFEPPQDFDAGAAAGRKPWQWAGPPLEVRLEFADDARPLVERIFGGAELRITFLQGLLPAVLQHGDKVWIARPEQAVKEARAALFRILQVHDGEPSPLRTATPPAAEAAPTTPKERERASPHERLRRLLLVVPAARKKPGIPLSELAAKLGISAEELREDIDLLGFVGRPPFSPDDLIDIGVDERDRVWVSLDQSFERPPQLLPLEALALAAACEEVAPADAAVREALRKLTEKLTPSARALYGQLARRVVTAAPLAKGAQAALETLRSAAEQREEVALRYESSTEERLYHPQGVVDHGGAWYAVGHDVGRGAERTFRVDRIVSLRKTGRGFADPGPLDPARFQRATLFLPTGHEQPVVLRFSKDAAPWALFRYGTRAQPLPDGGAEVWIASSGSSYSIQLTLSFAGEAELVYPLEARAALREAAARALSHYPPEA